MFTGSISWEAHSHSYLAVGFQCSIRYVYLTEVKIQKKIYLLIERIRKRSVRKSRVKVFFFLDRHYIRTKGCISQQVERSGIPYIHMSLGFYQVCFTFKQINITQPQLLQLCHHFDFRGQQSKANLFYIGRLHRRVFDWEKQFFEPFSYPDCIQFINFWRQMTRKVKFFQNY